MEERRGRRRPRHMDGVRDIWTPFVSRLSSEYKGAVPVHWYAGSGLSDDFVSQAPALRLRLTCGRRASGLVAVEIRGLGEGPGGGQGRTWQRASGRG